ncbi:MAG: tRNA (5-methylaminomethyl-2-thiouridine)(34)-methyltransferase MnmD [Cyclobacteriaceae bacterium]|jgi:tRNA U34 5-methylaminomethyl-2-thiouridine-forming methyltransferase MnmC
MKLLLTNDGSHTLMVEELNETYHSVHGALQESRHVFIKNGFRYILGKNPRKPLRIFELGLGTGLNALLTAMESHKLSVQVEYTCIEPYPVPEVIISQLNFHEILDLPFVKDYFGKIHSVGWDQMNHIHSFFKFRKVQSTIQEFNISAGYFHLVYYDAFAPNKQPEMWQRDVLQKVYGILSKESALVTYCAQGQVKRDLKASGFTVQSLQGPPGKKEMTRGLKGQSS